MGQLKRNDVRQLNTPLGDIIRLGDWYWYTEAREGAVEELYCVRELGSNYAEIKSPIAEQCRIHLDNFDRLCRHEPRADEILEERARACVGEIRTALEAIRGVDTRLCLGTGPSDAQASTTALSLYSGDDKAKHYEETLKHAKAELIPAEKQNIKNATAMLDVWVKARTYALRGEAKRIDSVMEKIDNRLMDLSIYAGLSESVEEVRKGQHSPGGEVIHIMQRLLYMDEECLLAYERGGMDFKEISAFDQWLAKPENLNRLMPFPRCVVGFRVRRHEKRRAAERMLDMFINIKLAEYDECTFLYIRNGEALYRICSEHEFGHHLFPLESDLSFTEPMMGQFDGDRFQYFLTEREEAERQKEREAAAERKRVRDINHRAWCRKYKPNKHRLKQRKKWVDPFWDHRSPFYDHHDHWRNDRGCHVEPFDDSSVYYDDMVAALNREIQDYNRLSLLLQGLLDRSIVFLPHPGIRMWNTDSATKHVKLVFDSSLTLHNGEPPSFEAYRAACDETLRAGCRTVGQAEVWKELREAEWEGNRYLSRYERRSQKYAGDGPPVIAKVVSVREGMATFEWRERSCHFYNRVVKRRLRVEVGRLLNLEAYRLGDYQQFFQDPRTRQQYLKWAPTLLFCEEYLSNTIDEHGNRPNAAAEVDESEEEYDEDEDS